jgi:autotransporter-associated beta strand protein
MRLFKWSWMGLLAAAAASAVGGTANFQATWPTASGAKTADYRIYAPPAADVPRIRGVVFLYPGSGGDWRFRADDTVWQEAARSLGCALVGAGSNAGYMSITETEARASVEAILAAAATASGRPEIVNAPALFAGFSLGGFVSTEMANDVCERVVACVPQRGSSAFNSSQPAAARRVPVLFMPGSLDSNGLTSPGVTDGIFEVWRSDGGRSAYAMDWLAGHDTFVNQGWSLAWVWLAECLALRYPEGAPSVEPGNPVALADIPLEAGWLGYRPYTTSSSGQDYRAHVDIAPYAAYTGAVAAASWLPSEAAARAYQALTSHDGVTTRAEIPLQGPVAIVGAAKPSGTVQPGQTNPPQLAVLPVGAAFDIEVDPRGFGREDVTLAPQNLLANGDFAQWASGLPTGWTCGNAAMISQGPDLGASGGSAVLRDKASLSQSFAPVATNFQLRFTFTVNLTPGSNTWNQPLIVNLFQSNQATNAASPWLTFRFTAPDVATGPFTAYAYTNNSSAAQLASTPVNGSTYDFGAGAFTGGPFAYEFVLNYSAASDSYSLSYGPVGGTLFCTGALRLFRNPTNPVFTGLQSVQFYAYVNGAALDGARLSVIESQTLPIASVSYYDGAELLGVQTEPGPGGWTLAHTLAARGIHGLTVVAEDPFGARSSAFRTVVAAEPVPSGVTHYRFERSPGFKTDQYDLLNLTSNATSGTGPQQVALAASGAGAAFPRLFGFGGGTNGHAARFAAASGDVFTCADSPLLPASNMPFTVEAFVNLASGGPGGTFRTLAAHGTGSTGSTLAWQLVVTGEGSGQGARRLVLQFCADNNGTVAGTLDTINSGFELQTNTDYYVAAVFTPTNTSASGITFYFKNLTAGGALQSSSRTHAQTSLFNSAASFAVGNRYNRDTGWDGLIDEFRLTTRALTASELLVNARPAPVVPGWVAADDTRIAYSDYVRKSFVAAPFDASVVLARFDRILTIAGKGYEWDNPGARIRFRTDATNAQASLFFNELHVSTSARNSRGLYRVDGQTNALWTFQTVSTATVRTQEFVTVSLAVPPGGGLHDYEFVLPYGDSVDFQGLQVNPEAQFEAPASRPATRYLAYGDSITHGFTASDVGGGYAFRIAEAKGWQLVNMGYGGRAATASDGATVGAQGADVITVLIGVNDWQGGVPLATTSNRLDGFLANLRAQQPTVPVYLLTPLWVDPAWDPAGDVEPLEAYRQVARDVAAARGDPNLAVIEGPALIDADNALFDAVRVHPNDAGFAQMAVRLAVLIEQEAPAMTKAWRGGAAADWADAATWTPSGAPRAIDAVSLSNSATGTLTVQSGTAAVAASLSFDNAAGKDATLAIAEGGSLAVSGAIVKAGSGAATVSNLTLTAPATAVSVTSTGTNAPLRLRQVGGPGGLSKSGSGTLRLAGALAYGGPTAVTAGTLDFAGAGVTLLTNTVTGIGTLRHSGCTTVVDAASANLNSFDGPVIVDGGTLQHGTANNNQRRGLSRAASYTVNAGATMVTTRDAMRDGVSTTLNNGTLKMLKGFQFLGPLTLNGGALVTGPGQGAPYQAFALGGNVTVTGGPPSEIRAEPGLNNGVHLAFNAAAGTSRTFRVEDVTTNAAADLTVSANLLESSHTGSSAGLVKTGAGTMLLLGGTNTYSGATVVSNGALLVSGSLSNSAVTAVSGAAFGTADATVSRVAALTLEEGATIVWRYDGEVRTAGRIDVAGTLTLPAAATLDVSGTGVLRSGQVLFSAGSLAGATELGGWTVTGTTDSASLSIIGNEVVLMLHRGSVIQLR